MRATERQYARRAMDRVKHAEQECRDALQAILPVGSPVRFRRQYRGPVYDGAVLMWGYDHERVKVVNHHTRKEYWIYTYWIEGLSGISP